MLLVVQENEIGLRGCVGHFLNGMDRLRAERVALVSQLPEEGYDIVRVVIELGTPFAEHFRENNRPVLLDDPPGPPEGEKLTPFHITFDKIDGTPHVTDQVVKGMQRTNDLLHVITLKDILLAGGDGHLPVDEEPRLALVVGKSAPV